MPIIGSSSYTALPLLGGKHLQTIFPTCFRHVPVSYVRERIETPDGDFLDLDWNGGRYDRLVILLHGLEGSSRSKYMRGMVRAFGRNGWDSVALNLRGCSGAPNRLLRSYHSGASEDLACAIEHILRSRNYRRICLLGFSLGGNILLKFLGETQDRLRAAISGAVAFSVPCDLKACSESMAEPRNSFYMRRFLRLLRGKMELKARLFPHTVSIDGYDEIRSFKQFDDRYTAPLHGFRDAYEYWRLSSSKQFLPAIKVPTLLISALDDPFLVPACIPVEEARANPKFFLETPPGGGHAGFMRFRRDGLYWSEERALEFLSDA